MPFADKDKEREYRAQKARERRAKEKTAAAPASPPPVPAPKKEKATPAPASPPPAPARVPPASLDYTLEEMDKAWDMVHKTKELIALNGFAIWKCGKLNNDLIVVIENEKCLGYPDGYPVYTFDELKTVSECTHGTLNIIHNCKVQGLQPILPKFEEVFRR